MATRKTPTDAQIAKWMEEADRRTRRIIAEHGVFIQFVGGDPSTRTTQFAYTVGLFELQHPELLVMGMCPDCAATVLNDVAAGVRQGAELSPGQMIEIARGDKLVVETLPNPGQILFAANSHYRRPDARSVPAFQLTYADAEGRFPWDAGCSIPAWEQPRPGEFRA